MDLRGEALVGVIWYAAIVPVERSELRLKEQRVSRNTLYSERSQGVPDKRFVVVPWLIRGIDCFESCLHGFLHEFGGCFLFPRSAVYKCWRHRNLRSNFALWVC